MEFAISCFREVFNKRNVEIFVEGKVGDVKRGDNKSALFSIYNRSRRGFLLIIGLNELRIRPTDTTH